MRYDLSKIVGKTPGKDLNYLLRNTWVFLPEPLRCGTAHFTKVASQDFGGRSIVVSFQYLNHRQQFLRSLRSKANYYTLVASVRHWAHSPPSPHSHRLGEQWRYRTNHRCHEFSPTPGDSKARDDQQPLPQHRWQSLHQWLLRSSRAIAQCIPRWTGAAEPPGGELQPDAYRFQ